MLEPSVRFPVLFIGHGSPMNAIEDNAFRRSWQALGQQFGTSSSGVQGRWPRPQLILCISAHWVTDGAWWVTGQQQPVTIHDFGGFPAELFAQQYPAPGAPGAAAEIARMLGAHVDDAPGDQGWGFDHGSWSVLKPMFPEADIPLIQLSMDYRSPPSEHYAMGRRLRVLRERGVLIVGSGNIVHNLRVLDFSRPDFAFDWARRFDDAAHAVLTSSPHEVLALRSHADYTLSAPTPEHFIPLLYVAGLASAANRPLELLIDGHAYGSASMAAYTLDAPSGQRGSRDPRPSAGMPDTAVLPAEDTNI